MLELTVRLDPAAKRPLYLQLYDALLSQLRRGTLTAGDKLPGKRTLAGQLSLSVNTVDAAYQMLLAEGYLESRERSGFFVLPHTAELPAPGGCAGEPPPPPHMAEKGPEPEFDLSPGAVDVELFPFRTWGKLQRDLLYGNPELLRHGPRQGEEELRRTLGEYLRSYRGVVCTPEQIVVGAGVEYLLGLVAQLLRGSLAAVENPGYRRGRTILTNGGVRCVSVDIDGAGLSPGGLERSGADLCYVTPSHHFPTAVTMPVGRRAQILSWAAQAPGRYILEDDYDAEFRFDTRPLPSLQGMGEGDGSVIYLSTFSKSLAPGIRIACMVLPRPLLGRYREAYGEYANTVSRFEQQTLRGFLEGGYFTRHLNRLRGIYKRRMEALIGALEEAFGGESLTLRGRHTGLHLLLQLRDGPGEKEMVRAALAEGVYLRGLGEYYMDRPERCPENTVLLGYASLRDEDVPVVARRLKKAWREG